MPDFVCDDASGSEHEAVCGELQGYLEEHPHAMDTLKGIVDWWLPRHEARVGTECVARALRTLEERGLIERVGEGEQQLFRLRRHRSTH